ncbi:MAG: hypothetical protein AAF721_18500 [Myxococcota bacterium]
MADEDDDPKDAGGEAGSTESDAEGDEDAREGRWGFTRLGEQLSGLLDPEAALRRGQGLVTGVTQATKDEAMRIVSAEVRNFLDGMDIADLAQQVISGLVVDVNMQVRFSREDDGLAQPTITKNETKIRTRREADAAGKDGSKDAPKDGSKDGSKERSKNAPKDASD